MAISLVTQIILGWLLIDRDFGVYAIAVALADFLRVFRDGGVSLWLARLPEDEFDQWAGPAYWLSFGCSLVTGGLLMLIAYPLGWIYAEPDITKLVLILALTFPIGSYTTVASPRLQVQLRFGSLATLRILSAILRYTCVIFLAWYGWGPYSFVVPMPVVMLFEGALCYYWTRHSYWSTPSSWHMCRQLLGKSGWSMYGSFATAILRQFDYAVYGLIAAASIVGVYFFAYQLTMQLVLLFSESLRRVVLPVFHRVSDDRAQQQRGLLLSGAFLGLIAGPAMFLLAVVAADLEQTLWHGRWIAAVPSIRLLAFAMPLHLTAFFIEMLVQSQGRFRLWTITVLVRGLGLGAAAWVGGLLGGRAEPACMAAAIAVYIGVTAVIEMVVLLRQLQLDARPILYRLLTILLCGALLAAGCIHYSPASSLYSPVVRGSLVGLLYLASFGVVALILFRDAVRDIVTLLSRLRRQR